MKVYLTEWKPKAASFVRFYIKGELDESLGYIQVNQRESTRSGGYYASHRASKGDNTDIEETMILSCDSKLGSAVVKAVKAKFGDQQLSNILGLASRNVVPFGCRSPAQKTAQKALSFDVPYGDE